MGTWLGGERFRHLARIAIIRQASSEFGVPLHLGKELFDFIRNREAKKQAVAVAVQPEVWGEAQLRAPGKGPGDDRSGVMGCVVEAKAVAITETVVHFSAPNEALAAEGAGLRRGGGRQDAASAYGVAELPGRVGKVFFSEKLKQQAESDCRFGSLYRDWRLADIAIPARSDKRIL